MIRIILIGLLWAFLSWFLVRTLNRIARWTRSDHRKSVQTKNSDPIQDAKKADVIDIN